MSTRTAIVGFFTIAALIAVFHLGFSSSTGPSISSRIMSTFKDRSSTGSVTDQLQLRLEQTASAPSTVRVTMQNNSPDQTLTVLNWDTPFDPNALMLGVFHIADAGSGEEIPPLGLKVNRKLPPGRDALLELVPGAKLDKDIVIDPALVPVEPGKQYNVQAKGTFKSVWTMKAGDVGEGQLSSLGGGKDSSTGAFESDSVPLKVD